MKRLTVLLFILSVLLSCTKREQTDVLVLGVMPSMDYLPLAVAAEKGFLDKAGLKLTIKKFYSAVERDAAFQSGNVDGTVIDYTGAILQSAGGIDLKIVSACDAPFYIAVGKNTGITDISGLKGKKVAVSQNTVIDYCIDKALAHAGFLASDIEKAEINRIPLRFELLDNGKIDATALPGPFAAKALSTGNALITSNTELGFAITGIVFSGKALKSKRALIKKMYEAYDLGAEYIRTHGIDDIKGTLIDEMGFAEEDLKYAVISYYNDALAPSEEDIASAAEWLASRGLIADGFVPGNVIDASVLEK
jgi:NitT/TauT family transport system substrate-binding protein